MKTTPNPTFTWVKTPDLHLERRRTLLKLYPDVRKLFGYDLRTAVLICILVVTQFNLGAWIGHTQSWAGTLWGLMLMSYFVGGVLNHWLAMGMHECAHNLAAPTPNLNRWLAILANFPIVLPGAMAFRRWHLDHHRYLGQRGRDNDLPSDLEVRFVGRSFWLKSLWLLFFLPVSSALRGFMKPPSRWEWINIGIQALVTGLTFWLLGGKTLAYFGLSTFLGFGLHPAAAHWIHEHYLYNPKQETYSYYGPLNWVNFNVGYHVEHHDLFNIPGWRLPQLKRMAAEFYEPLVSHRSWTLILWKFLTDPTLGNFSRIERASSLSLLLVLMTLGSTTSLPPKAFALERQAPARVWQQTDYLQHWASTQDDSARVEVIEIPFNSLQSAPDGVVLLIPGFTQNGTIWDLWPEKGISFARHLMRDLHLKVYLLNPSGKGNSDPMGHGSTDDIAINDIPSAIAFTFEREKQNILVMGHSEGGISLLASLSGLNRRSDGTAYFSREVAQQRQSKVRAAISVASNVTMRSELPWIGVFRNGVKVVYQMRWFLDHFYDQLKLNSPALASLARIVNLPQWKVWNFLYTADRLTPEVHSRIHEQTIDGTTVQSLEQFVTAMIANQGDQGMQAIRGPYYWQGLKNIEQLPVATVFFENDSMARPIAGYEDTFLRIPSPRKMYRTYSDQAHEDFALMPSLHTEMDELIVDLMKK